MTEVQKATGGPHCAMCGDGADDLIVITSQCEKNGLGKFVCLHCCTACDLHTACPVYVVYAAAHGKKE